MATRSRRYLQDADLADLSRGYGTRISRISLGLRDADSRGSLSGYGTRISRISLGGYGTRISRISLAFTGTRILARISLGLRDVDLTGLLIWFWWIFAIFQSCVQVGGRLNSRTLSGILVHDPAELRLAAEVEQQPDFQIGGLEVVEQLRLMKGLNLGSCFHFDDQARFYDQVRPERRDAPATEPDGQCHFLEYFQSSVLYRYGHGPIEQELRESRHFVEDVKEHLNDDAGFVFEEQDWCLTWSHARIESQK